MRSIGSRADDRQFRPPLTLAQEQTSRRHLGRMRLADGAISGTKLSLLSGCRKPPAVPLSRALALALGRPNPLPLRFIEEKGGEIGALHCPGASALTRAWSRPLATFSLCQNQAFAPFAHWVATLWSSRLPRYRGQR